VSDPAWLRGRVGASRGERRRDGRGAGSRQLWCRRRCPLDLVDEPAQVLAEVVAGHEAESEQSSQTRAAGDRVLERIQRIPGVDWNKVGKKRVQQPACLVEWGRVHERSSRRVVRKRAVRCSGVALQGSSSGGVDTKRGLVRYEILLTYLPGTLLEPPTLVHTIRIPGGPKMGELAPSRSIDVLVCRR
jgi:hypothetical protein